MPKKVQKNFESSIAELEDIVSFLEKGEVSLEESIKRYKDGMDLAAYCLSVLKKAEQEIYVYEEDHYKKIEGEDWK
ncbi:MAG: Exonuclease small subunit [Clostridia bacterium]|nr:Exonuclease small subunit [Clostridia bacterium]